MATRDRRLARPAGGAIFTGRMRKSGWIIPAALLLLAAFATPAAADPLVLRGEAQRGDTVVHPFEHDGQAFEFRLKPVGHGWSIWIGYPVNRERNQIVVATPPYRGINPAIIQGWHFRNADNSGPNKPGKDHVNAPQKIRHFAFVLDGAGYQAAHAPDHAAPDRPRTHRGRDPARAG